MIHGIAYVGRPDEYPKHLILGQRTAAAREKLANVFQCILVGVLHAYLC